MIKIANYFVIFILCLSFNLFSESLQYENQLVEKIHVEVVNLSQDTGFDFASITARMKTRQGDLFSQIDFDNDLKILAQEFDRIEPSLATIDGKLYITLKLWPKPTIRMISWNGNEKIETKKLQKELGITVCSVFDRQAFNTAFHKLKAYYVQKGFFEADLNYSITLDPITNNVDITICINEGRVGRIKNIKFVNFTKAERAELLDMIATKEYFLFTSWYTGNGTYNEDAIQQDRFTILNFLQNEGYADASVDIQVEEACENRINIIITAYRGDLYYFGPITFEGNHLFCDEEIATQLQYFINQGDPYSPEQIRDAVRRLNDFYGRRGYIDAIIDFEPVLDCDTRSYSLHLTIEEGEQYRVGLIRVFGNCSTQTGVILHETLLVPGEVFNIIKLQLTEERLRNINYFKNVNVYAVRSEGPGGLGGHYRDVNIEVEETVTGNFGAGFGLSSVESIFGEFRITERNFNYKGLGCFWKDGFRALRGGGEFVHLSAMVGAKSRKYSFSWTKPFFNDTLWVVGFEITNSNNRYISNDYAINSTGITVHGAYPFNNFLRFGLHYRLTNAYITIDKHRIKKEARKFEKKGQIAEAEGKKHEAEHEFHEQRGITSKLREEAKNLGLISAIGISLNYDCTDNPSRPTRGFKSRIEEELAGFGGDHTFMSLAYLNSYYIRAGLKGVIRLRGDMRFIVPLFDTKRFHIPLDERLFLGGDNTIRGYRVYRLGPQFNTGDPRGGMSMQLLSAEYTRVLGKRVSAFVFCDSGHLSFDVWNFGTMWTSVGFGVNLQVLGNAPPVVLGIGFPLNPDRRSDVKRFFFNIGGRF